MCVHLASQPNTQVKFVTQLASACAADPRTARILLVTRQIVQEGYSADYASVVEQALRS